MKKLFTKVNVNRVAKTFKDIKIANSSHGICDADVINAISELLIADYAVEQKAYIEQIERGVNRNITPLLSTKFKEELYKVSENVADEYSAHCASSTILASVEIEYTTDVRVDVTIYLTDASSATIYTDKFSGDILLVSEDSYQNTYLEKNLTTFDYKDIQSALKCMIEYMFSKHQQARVKKYAKKQRLTNPVVWMDIDFSYQLYSPAIEIEDHMKPTYDDRIKLKIDYFRGDWTHIRVTITLFDTLGDRETVKISGDVEIWGL